MGFIAYKCIQVVILVGLWLMMCASTSTFVQIVKIISEAHKQCSKFGGQLAYRVLKNVTISTPRNELDKSTKLSLFWDMFHHMEDISPSIRAAFNKLVKTPHHIIYVNCYWAS